MKYVLLFGALLLTSLNTFSQVKIVDLPEVLQATNGYIPVTVTGTTYKMKVGNINNISISTVDSLKNLSVITYQRATVGDQVRGGSFVARLSSDGFTVDSGMVYPSAITGIVWVRDMTQSQAINIKWFGVKGDGSDETGRIRRAINSVPSGFTLYLPKPSATCYLVSDTIAITKPIIIRGESSVNTEIRQSTWGKPIFDVYGVDGLDISRLYLTNSGTRIDINGGYRSYNLSSYCAGIWLQGNNNNIHDLRIKGFVAGVFLAGDLANHSSKNTVYNIAVDTVDFGVLMSRNDFCVIRGITGTFVSSQPDDPPHLLYLVNEGIGASVSDCHAFDGNGYAYQFKQQTRGAFDNLTAKGCAGVLSMVDDADCNFNSIISDSDICTQYSVFIQRGTTHNLRNVFNGLTVIKDSLSVGLGFTLDGDDNVMNNVTIRTGNNAGSTLINRINGGNRNIISNLNVDATNSVAGNSIALSLSGGTNHVIKNPVAKNVGKLIQSTSGVTGAQIQYDPSVQSVNTTRLVQIDDPSTFSIMRSAGVKSFTATSGTVNGTIDGSQTSLAIISANDNASFTIANPIEPYKGNILQVQVVNNTAGTMGSINWGSSYLVATDASPAPGASKTWNFVYDGTYWSQIGGPLAITIGLGGGNFNSNTAIGNKALGVNVSGGSNTALGYQALSANTTGNSNSASGYQALFSNTTGGSNAAFGYQSAYTNSTGNQNTSTGVQALYSNTGNNNSAYGYKSLYTATGSGNSAYGHNSLTNQTTGTNNSSFGYSSGFDNLSGNQNTFVGWNTGRGITTGNYNTVIGANITGLSAGLSNNVIIGDGQGNVRFQSDASGNITLPVPSNGVAGTDSVMVTNNGVVKKIPGSYYSASTSSSGYSMQGQFQSTSPADAATIYIGSVTQDVSAASTKIYIPKSGTITKVSVFLFNSVLGTNEASSIYVRLNNTTDYLISSAVDNSASFQRVINTSMSVPVSGDFADYVEIKWVCPTWATNPTVRGAIVLWIQ
jgi:hypothetical protein